MNQTPFYGESGGQVGDTGEMRREGVRLIVSDTQKKAGDLFAHVVKVEQGCGQGRRSVAAGRRSRAAQRNSSKSLGNAPSSRGAAPGAGRSRRAERFTGRTRQVTVRFLASQANVGGGNRTGRRHRQRHRSAERTGDDPPDGVSMTQSHRVRARFSARNTATRCGSSQWARAPATPWAGQWNCAAAPMCAVPAT